MRLLTIGHSNHPLDKFIGLLADNHVMILVDVRTSPYSRYNPQFNRESIASELHKHAIRYKYEGKNLGGRPSDPSCYKNGIVPGKDANYLREVDYQAVMRQQWFQSAVDGLLTLAAEETAAIMCSEENPEECHRHHLIRQYIVETRPDVSVEHIRGDGIVVDAHEFDKPSQSSLF